MFLLQPVGNCESGGSKWRLEGVWVSRGGGALAIRWETKERPFGLLNELLRWVGMRGWVDGVWGGGGEVRWVGGVVVSEEGWRRRWIADEGDGGPKRSC